MLFHRDNKRESKKKQNQEKDLYPILHVINSLKEYHTELVSKEVSSLWELNLIGTSFNSVLEEAEGFQGRLQDFGQNFLGVNQASEQFATVREEIAQSVGQAQNEVESLKSSSMEVETHFSEMGSTFEALQESVEHIKQRMTKIVSIADQTNILAINASIEAARAGEAGKGTDQLSERINVSRQALGESLDKVQETYNMFDKITQAAEGTTTVQTEIAGVIGESQTALQGLLGFFDKMKGQYQEVINHITKASRLGTTKSAMFEDIDNLLSQIPPIIKE